MGTSSSNKGSKGNSPIVPYWADLDGQGPGPTGDSTRFKSFRTKLGKYVATGDRRNLEAALGSYARKSLGGIKTGVRRFAPMVQSGTSLFGLLSEFQQGGTGIASIEIDLSRLRGMDVATAIQEIVEALTPKNGDRELIRAAMHEAMTDCLADQVIFDPADLTEDFFVNLIIEYLVRCVFVHIVYESGAAFDKTTDTTKAAAAENELFELVRVVVDEKSATVLASSGPLTSCMSTTIQKQVIEEVLKAWEGYT